MKRTIYGEKGEDEVEFRRGPGNKLNPLLIVIVIQRTPKPICDVADQQA
jgi:hypothetical protein